MSGAPPPKPGIWIGEKLFNRLLELAHAIAYSKDIAAAKKDGEEIAKLLTKAGKGEYDE